MLYQRMMLTHNLIDEFKTCTQLQYNGNLTIKSPKGHQWIFYYRLGRIVWASGGTHPCRRLRRQMSQYCPQIDVDNIRLTAHDLSIDYWDYRLLENLHKKQKIQREQMDSIVENTIAELFFDIAQQADFSTLTCNRNQQVILDVPISFTNADISLTQMQDSWKLWSEAGLRNVYPDLAPILQKPEQLQQVVNASVYNNFLNLINGKSTLRDLAVKMKQNVMPVARSLLPYILKGIIELVEVPDLPLPVIESEKNLTATKAQSANTPLIACVDDSPQICKLMEEIITSQGLRFIKIPDAVQALPTLIQNKPDLIFLDLMMPVASGYEICAQLRRISSFANTPVIILTGNDGLVDRVRAKVAGSTDYLTKPVATDKVMGIVRKYLPIPVTSINRSTSKINS